MRKDNFSTTATSMGNDLSLNKSSAMVQVSKGTACRIAVQILKNSEQIAHKISHRICNTEILPCITPAPW